MRRVFYLFLLPCLVAAPPAADALHEAARLSTSDECRSSWRRSLRHISAPRSQTPYRLKKNKTAFLYLEVICVLSCTWAPHLRLKWYSIAVLAELWRMFCTLIYFSQPNICEGKSVQGFQKTWEQIVVHVWTNLWNKFSFSNIWIK